ncbi:MAG: cyclic nucleotide-binding/CBS domain-containing protein [Oligoflexales bacterium]
MRQFINSAPFYLSHDTSLLNAVKLMASHPCGYFLVNDSRTFLVGIVTRRDLLKKLASIDLRKAEEETVEAAMSSPVEYVCYKTLNFDVIKSFERTSLKKFPVLRCGSSLIQKNVVGVIQLSDFAISTFTNSYLRH